MTPDPAHIDAVARAINGPGWRGKVDAERILTSTDPAVHAAMLDALTRHGVLEEQSANLPVWAERERTATDAGLVLDDTPVSCISTWEPHRRLVTSWEVTP